MFAWQLTQLRPSTCFSLREYGLVGWRLSTWHCWQSRGLATFSRFSWFEPCGSWQVAQLSTTGACSQRKGPRFSAWQVKHVSLAEFSLRSAGVTVPCGLWQAVQVILPSRSGMCEERIVCARFWRGHWPQVSVTVARASWARDEVVSMSLWQLSQPRLSVELRGCLRKRRPILVCSNLVNWSS